MRTKYNWPVMNAEYELAQLKELKLTMSAFARARGIPESTFRKAIQRFKAQQTLLPKQIVEHLKAPAARLRSKQIQQEQVMQLVEQSLKLTQQFLLLMQRL